MSKRDRLYVGHMLDMAEKAVGQVEDVSYAQYNSDETLQLALTHLVQTIGEAARRVSSARQAAYPQIPWREIIGMRHKIVHDYLDVNIDIVWQVVTGDLPPLIEALQEIISEDSL